MATKELTNFRLSPGRKAKLKAIALETEKDMTRIIEDLIDTLPDPRDDKRASA